MDIAVECRTRFLRVLDYRALLRVESKTRRNGFIKWSTPISGSAFQSTRESESTRHCNRIHVEIAFESTHTLATGLDSVRETIATAFELQTNEADQRFHKTMDGQKQISTRLSSQVHTLCHGGLLWKRSTREESENKSETNRSVDNRRLSFVLFDAFFFRTARVKGVRSVRRGLDF